MKEEFEQLREFLQKEETARMAALLKEDEEKKELARKKSENITRSIFTFSHAVIAIENEIGSSDALFLKVIHLSLSIHPIIQTVSNPLSLDFRITPTQRKGHFYYLLHLLCISDSAH